MVHLFFELNRNGEDNKRGNGERTFLKTIMKFRDFLFLLTLQAVAIKAVNFLGEPIDIQLNRPVKIGGLFQFGTDKQAANLAENSLIVEAFQQAVAAQCAISQFPGGQYIADFRNNKGLLRTANDQTIDLLKQPVASVVGPAQLSSIEFTSGITSPSNTPQFELSTESLATIERVNSISLFQLLPFVQYEAAAMIATLQHFGWTLAAGVFDVSANGLAGYAQITAQAAAAGISLTCFTTFDPMPNTKQALNLISDCISSSSKINVVILWMGYDLAQAMISAIHSQSGTKDVIFFASDRWSYLFTPQRFAAGTTNVIKSKPFPVSYLEGTFGFYPYSNPPTAMKQCFNQLTPSTKVPGMTPPQVTFAWETLFACVLSGSNLPKCPQNVSERMTLCACTGTEKLNPNLIIPSAAYAWDSTMLTISALQKLKSQGKTTVTTLDITNTIASTSLSMSATGIGPLTFKAYERQSTVTILFTQRLYYRYFTIQNGWYICSRWIL